MASRSADRAGADHQSMGIPVNWHDADAAAVRERSDVCWIDSGEHESHGGLPIQDVVRDDAPEHVGRPDTVAQQHPLPILLHGCVHEVPLVRLWTESVTPSGDEIIAIEHEKEAVI